MIEHILAILFTFIKSVIGSTGYAGIALLMAIESACIALPAGVARMPRGKFHLYTFLGSWPWCLALAYFGMKLGENWRSLGKYFHQFDAVIGVVLVGAVGWFVWSHWQNRLRAAD